MMNSTIGWVRPAAAAGRFYPGDARELRALVESLLFTESVPEDFHPKALIVPHAGYIYSGPIAASAYASLRNSLKNITRVVLVGPAHFVPVRGLAASSAEAFATPLGIVRIDPAAAECLAQLPQVCVDDEAHAREHSLEVQLPFLQVMLGEFELVPLLVGEATSQEVATVLEELWGGDETRLIISSDLSHYLDSEAARKLDRVTATAIEHLDAGAIAENQACGRVPICGLLRAASARGLTPHTLDLRNSGDTAGPRDQVVGYGAFMFCGL